MFYFIVTNQYINTQMITSTGGGCCNFLNSILDSEEIWASQVEPVKPAKCSESSNPAHDTAKLSLVAGSWLFHDEDDDDANLWQLGLFAKIGRCVSRFITTVMGV